MNYFYRPIISGHLGHFARLFNPKTIVRQGILPCRCFTVHHSFKKSHAEDNQHLKTLLGDLSEKTISKASKKNEGSLKASFLTADQLFHDSSSMFPFYKDVITEQKEITQSICDKCRGLKPQEVLTVLEEEAFSDVRTWEVLCSIKDVDWTDPDICFILATLSVESFESVDVQKCLQYFVNDASLSESSIVRHVREKLDSRATELLKGHLDKSDMLTIASQWVKIFQVSDESFHSCQYLKEFTRTVIFHKTIFRDLNCHEFVFVLHVCGILRYFPGRENQSQYFDEHEGFDMPPALQSKIVDMGHQFSVSELGIIAHSLHKTYISIGAKNSDVALLFSRALLKIPDSQVIMYEFVIGSLAKILRRRGLKNNREIEQIMMKYSNHLKNLSSETKVRILGMMHSCPPTDVARFLGRVAFSFGNFEGVRIKDLEFLTHSFFHLNLKKNRNEILTNVSKALDKIRIIDVRHALSLVGITSTMCKMDYFEDQNINRILKAANVVTQQDVFSSPFSLSLAILEELVDEAARPKSPSHRSTLRVSNSLFAIAEIDIALEISNKTYPGTRLNQDALQVCLKTAPRAEKSGQGTNPESFRLSVQADLEEIFGSNIYHGHLMPHSTYRDLALCLDISQKNPSVVSNEALPKNLTSKIVRPQCESPNHRWFVFIVPKVGLFCEATQTPLGPPLAKKLQLQRLGYVPMIVPTLKYKHAQKVNQTHNVIITKIMSEIFKIKNKPKMT